MGALDALRRPYNWYQNGELTQQEAADHFADILDEAYEGGCVTPSVPAPVWEDDEEADDEEADDVQPWYGYVENPEDPPEELEFRTQVGIWALTGFIAFATFEVGFAPAIVFNAIAPKFALAWQRGDVGEVIKIFVKTVEGEYEQAAEVDTTSWDEGDVRDVSIVAGDEPEERVFLVMAEPS